MCNPLGYGRLKVSLHTCSSLAPSPSFLTVFASFRRRICSTCAFGFTPFGFTPPEFSQVALHLIDHFLAPILAPSP